MPERIQRKRTKGWRMPEGAVYVGRPTKWGNPAYIGGTFSVGEPSGLWLGQAGRRTLTATVRSNATATSIYLGGLRTGMSEFHNEGVWSECHLPSIDEIRAELAGKDLVCWCPLEDEHGNRVPCHADVLLELANGGTHA
ncbi:DUF4326 domain-containing protein [Rhodococcus ruber]|uniref:DUF4326 domain-containing protein n=1 Tax=Rhodococcus ruber TaxID=1830 RepID=UPI001932326C|nr:DUF4326 domain-containing protein [Rhodococcus ruber]